LGGGEALLEATEVRALGRVAVVCGTVGVELWKRALKDSVRGDDFVSL
jgi:hypothetical protein